MIEFNENIGVLQVFLVCLEFDVNYRNKENLILLYVVVVKNWEYVVKFFMERKDLDVNVMVEFDLILLYFVVRLGYICVLKQFFNDDDRLFLYLKIIYDFCVLYLVVEGDEENLGFYLNFKRSFVE